MKLRNCRVTNYRCVENSEDVKLGDFTILVGKNESGKTSILRALQKLNSDAPKFDDLKEFPRRRHHEYKKDTAYPIVIAEFEFSEKDKNEIQKIDPTLSNIIGVKIIKDTHSNYRYEFLPKGPDNQFLLDCKEWVEFQTFVANFKTPVTDSDIESIRAQLLQSMNGILSGIDHKMDVRDQSLKSKFEQLKTTMQNSCSTESRKKYFEEINKAITNLVIQNKENYSLPHIEQYIKEHTPRFIYFDIYQTLENRIDLPTYIQHLRQGAMTKEEQTANTLFALCNLDVEELVRLGTPTGKTPEDIKRDKDRRGLMISRASVGITGRVASIWKQKENKIEFYLDGDYLRLWVVDARDGSKLDYEEQSKGFQSFFSFYVIFNVESERGHKDSILLLDEPGLHLHPAAQENMIDILKQLSKTNQLIYTTHSPFMIDTDHLECVCLVMETAKEGTRIFDIADVRDPDTLFPLQAALGYTISQSLFVGKNNLIVEGVTDYWLLTCMSNVLRELKHKSLNDDIVITPAGGAQKTSYLASMMMGQKLRFGILLDADPEGRIAFKDLTSSKLVKEKNITLINEAISDGRNEAELEDLFPDEFYVKVVNEVYQTELGDKPLVCPLPRREPRIVQKVEMTLKERGITFHKSRPARRMMDIFAKIDPKSLPSVLLENFERLFILLNERQPKID